MVQIDTIRYRWYKLTQSGIDGTNWCICGVIQGVSSTLSRRMTIPEETLGLSFWGLGRKNTKKRSAISCSWLSTVDLSFPYHTLYGSVLELQLDLASDDDLISRSVLGHNTRMVIRGWLNREEVGLCERVMKKGRRKKESEFKVWGRGRRRNESQSYFFISLLVSRDEVIE